MTEKKEDIINKTEFNGTVNGPINTSSAQQINNFYNYELKSFDMNWAKKNIDKALAEAGSRYAPKYEDIEDLNIKVPIAELFDGIGLTRKFWDEFKKIYGDLRREYFNNIGRINSFFNNRYRDSNKAIEDIASDVDFEKDVLFDFFDANISFKDSIKNLRADNRDSFYKKEAELCGIWIKLNLNNYIKRILDFLNYIIYKDLSENTIKKVSDLISEIDYAMGCLFEAYSSELKQVDYEIRQLRKKLSIVDDFIISPKVRLALRPYMMLVGDALVGKTHLLCDIAKERLNDNLPTVLILGQHLIGNEPPWNQIIKELGLNCSQEEFIKELDSWAGRSSSRLIIMIDALNEGNGKAIWYEKLAGFLEDLKEYPNIGLVVSVRTSELNDTIRHDIIGNYFIQVTHPGFLGVEYQALLTYCKAFGLSMPKMPVISSSFLNPGFLYILCKGLKNKKQRNIPMGSKGLNFVFENFIDSVHERIHVRNYLNYDKYTNLVNSSLNAIAKKMIENDTTWIKYEEAKTIVNAFLPGRDHEKSLFNALISEGLINRDRYIVNDKEVYGIRFSYQKFENYLFSRYLLDTHLDKQDLQKSFSQEEKLGSILTNRRYWSNNLLIIEALFIMIPERVNVEVFDLLPELSKYEIMCEKFIDSLLWRNANTISENTLKYINENIVHQNGLKKRFLDVLLTLASDIDHPYNADFLHKNLIKLNLAERDAFWTTFIHYEYGARNSVDRLIDWAWTLEDKENIDDKAMELCATAISWFLSSSNRFLRDRATKALVALLSFRINVISELIYKFLNVNDCYILERLFAVAYGCVLRSTDNKNIKILALNIYEWIFKNGKPPINILLRDYARGVIEFAVYKGLQLNIDFEKIVPPYNSKWASRIPSKKELQEYENWDDTLPEEKKQIRYLYHSIMGQSDFARYVIGTNSGTFDWNSRRLNRRKIATKEERYEKYINSLTKKQKNAWDVYIKSRNAWDVYKSRTIINIYSGNVESKQLGAEEDTTQIDKMKKDAEKAFLDTIKENKTQMFFSHILPYLNNPVDNESKDRFDISIVQRYIFKRVLELGWKAKLFGDFDNRVNRYSSRGREANKPERIGKKYQWIAYHEILALVADNFEFLGDEWNNKKERYEGTWQLNYIRDIDPSCILLKTNEAIANKDTWWLQYQYNSWNLEINNLDWLKKSSDLPTLDTFFDVENPDDLSRWLVLEGFYNWIEDIPSDENTYENPRRELWYMLKSYIVKKEDADKVYNWAMQQNFAGRWMPESHEQTSIFLGEYFWSQAFKYHNVPYYMHEGWTRGEDDKIPGEVLVTTDKYLKESNTFDCSVDEGIRITLPCNWIVEKMNLVWTGKEGCYSDKKGNLVVTDPSIYAKGPSVLLIKKDLFLNFLESNGYEVIWTVLGEKNMIGGQRDEWEGNLEISGAYRILDDKVTGKTTTLFSK